MLVLQGALAVLIVSVASGHQLGGHRYDRRMHRHAYRSGLVISVPPPHMRDHTKCEAFESQDWNSYGCEKSCSLQGNLGQVTLRDPSTRMLKGCKSAGSYCKAQVTTSGDASVNVTYSGGQCNDQCQCVVRDNDDPQVMLQLQVNALKDMVKGYLNAKPTKHHKLEEGIMHVERLRITIPSAESRNQTHCEDYESTMYTGYMGAPVTKNACKQECQISGNIGSLTIESEGRALKADQPDGTTCQLTHSPSDSVRVFGTDHVTQGECKKGICQHAEQTTTPTMPVVHAQASSESSSASGSGSTESHESTENRVVESGEKI